MWCSDRVRRLCLALVLLVLTVAGCGSGDTVDGQVSEVADSRLCVKTATTAGLCFVATDQQLKDVKVGTCVDITFSGGSNGVQPVAVKIMPKKPPCVAQG